MKKGNFAIVLLLLLLGAACNKKQETKIEKYQLTEEASVAVWKGYLRTGYFNEGTIQVKSENLEVASGKVKGGTFHMPLSSLKNLNLPPEVKQQLIHHLQSSDFFNMALHPDVSFTITKVEPYTGNDPNAVDEANFTVSGSLTMLGKSLPLAFPAKIHIGAGSIDIAAKLKVDRTKWGMTYASDPTLPDDKYILPEMAIDLDLTGVKK